MVNKLSEMMMFNSLNSFNTYLVGFIGLGLTISSDVLVDRLKNINPNYKLTLLNALRSYCLGTI
jgi:hypothetical protein